MPLRVDLNILNQKGTPAFYSDTFANRPAAGFAGRVFISIDTGAIYEDTGSTWTLIADAGAGTTGTLQQVTTNGNTTTQGISITAGGLISNSIDISAQTLSSTASYIGQVMAGSDYWKIYGYATTGDRGEMVFELGDNGEPYSGIGERFRFSYTATATGTAKDVLLLDYDTTTFNTSLIANSFTSSALTSGSVLFAGYGGLVSQKNSNFFWDNTNNRLGIGNSSPGAPLDVHCTGTAAQFNGTGTNNTYIVLQNAGVSKWRIGNTYNSGANSLDIFNSNLATNAISISNSTNNVLIGTSTDNGRTLQVNGVISCLNTTGYLLRDGTSTGYGIFKNNATQIGFAVDGNVPFYLSSTGVGTFTNLAGTGSRAVLADASGNLSAPVSDISVKENIKPIGYGLNEILKMNPVWFDYISEYKNYGESRQNGNIAQEMQQIIPEAVFTTPSTNKMGINYDQLHAVYIKAIQEINDKLVRNNIN